MPVCRFLSLFSAEPDASSCPMYQGQHLSFPTDDISTPPGEGGSWISAPPVLPWLYPCLQYQGPLWESPALWSLRAQGIVVPLQNGWEGRHGQAQNGCPKGKEMPSSPVLLGTLCFETLLGSACSTFQGGGSRKESVFCAFHVVPSTLFCSPLLASPSQYKPA